MSPRTITTAAVAALLLLPATGVTAAPSAAQHRIDAAAGLGTVTHQATRHGGTVTGLATSSLDRSGLALQAFDPRRPATLIDAARALSGLQDEPDATETTTSGGTTDVSETPWTYRSLDVVDDLDGDGVADTIVTTTSSSMGQRPTSHVQARRGSDGTVLWEGAGIGGGFASSAGDVDGDGIGELLLIGLEVTEEEYTDDCDDDSCTFSADVELIWTLGVLDGATGEVRWASTEVGAYTYDERYDFEAGTYSYSVEGTNLFGGAEPLDTAATGRLLWNMLDLSATSSLQSQDPTGLGQGIIATSQERSRVRSSTRAELLSTRDGQSLLTRRTEDVAGVSHLQVAGQMVGDPTADVLWTTRESTDGSRDCTAVLSLEDCQGERSVVTEVVEVVDGRDLTTAWTTRLPEDMTAFVFALGADLDGDGATDIMALTYAQGEPDLTGSSDDDYATTVLSGATGDPVWTVLESDWLFPIAVDDLDGDEAVDLLTALVDFDAERFSPSIRLLRVDGATGEVLLETAAPQGTEPDPDAQCVFGFGYVGGMDDGDGDGVADLFGGDVTESSTDCGEGYATQHLMWGESGRDGSVVYESRGEGARSAFPLGDLDGDGLTDLLIDTVTSEDGDVRVEATAATLPDLVPLWTATLQGYSHLYGVPDLDGDGLADVVADLDDTQLDGDGDAVSYSNLLRIRRGTDGAVMWGAPDVPTVFSRVRD